MLTTKQQLSGWGRITREMCYVFNGATVEELSELIAGRVHGDYIARGLGRAYGDSSLNQERGVICQSHRRRFLAFHEASGILSCEAGVSLREIIACFLPRGWFLPVTPGTKDVTIGGAIAADVHGKNHHIDGSFGNFVLDLDLLTASGTVLHCSPTQHAEAFWATIGGMGLTGIILRARIQLRRVASAYCNVTYRRTTNLDDTLACFEQNDHRFRYSVAWIDCLATGKRLGRSVVMLANDAQPEELSGAPRQRPLRVPERRPLPIPCEFPAQTLNPWTVGAFNALYYARHADATRIVDLDSFFYPLDGISQWNRIYGRRGFLQYQALFPSGTSHQGLVELLQEISASKCGSFLAVLKSCGAASRGLLSYLRPGHTLALDIPNDGKRVRNVVRKLDEILLQFGGCLYLAKDSMTTASNFAAMYPQLAEFKRIKAGLDPENKFASSQARRLGIVDTPHRPFESKMRACCLELAR